MKYFLRGCSYTTSESRLLARTSAGGVDEKKRSVRDRKPRGYTEPTRGRSGSSKDLLPASRWQTRPKQKRTVLATLLFLNLLGCWEKVAYLHPLVRDQEEIQTVSVLKELGESVEELSQLPRLLRSINFLTSAWCGLAELENKERHMHANIRRSGAGLGRIC